MPRIGGRIQQGARATLRASRPRVVETLGPVTPGEHVTLRIGHRSEAPDTLPLATTDGGGLTIERSADGLQWSAEVPQDVAEAAARGDLAVSPRVQPATITRPIVTAQRVEQRLSGPVTELALMSPAEAAYAAQFAVEAL